MALAVLVVLLCMLSAQCFGVSLHPCINGWFTAVEGPNNGSNVITCTGFGSSNTVTWYFSPSGGGSIMEIVYCPPLPSTCSNSMVFVTGNRSSDTSQLTFETLTVAHRGLAGATLSCRRDSLSSAQCQIHLVKYPSSVECSAQFHTDTTPWTVSGLCHITKVYSSLGQYRCQWSQSDGSISQVISDVNMTTTPNPDDGNYTNGVCIMEGQPLPLTDGTYNYTVMTSPGSSSVTAVFNGSSVIRTPSIPTITGCSSSDFVPELSTIECTCGTDDVGSPPGTLQWEPASPTPQLDSSKLVISNVSRGDNGTESRCAITWNQRILRAQQTYTVLVAYGPYRNQISIASDDFNTTFDTDGQRELRMTCTYADVIPAAEVMWLDPIGCRGQGQTCSIRPLPPGDVTFKCQVTNEQNNGKAGNVSRTVVLNYPPSQDPLISGYTTGEVLNVHDALTLTCEATGGQPAVTSVTLTCQNYPPSETDGTRSELSVHSLRADDHMTTCTCTARWKVPSLYTQTHSVTLLVYSPPTMVQLTVNSEERELVVNETDSGSLLFVCSASGVPTPSLALVDDLDRQWKTVAGGSTDVTDRTSRLTLSSPDIRCEDSATYRCKADNSVGSATSGPVLLRVLCNMRVATGSFTAARQEDDLPLISTAEGQGQIEFKVLTTETPRAASFLDLKTTSFPQPVRIGFLSVQCEHGSVPFRSDCVITADNVTTDDVGLYNLTLETDTESLTFTFYLDFNGHKTEEATPVNTSANGGLGFGPGLGVGLCVSVILVAVALVWLWRRRWKMPCAAVEERHVPAKTTTGTDTSSIELTFPQQWQARGPYDDLRQEDIGQRSHYDVIGLQPSQPTGNQDNDGEVRGPYDDLRQEDIGQRSHYDVIGLQPLQSSQPTRNQHRDTGDYEIPANESLPDKLYEN